MVDDDPQALRACCRMLERDNDVVATISGTRAWELLSESSYDVLVTDRHLPDMTGLELVGKLDRLRADIGSEDTPSSAGIVNGREQIVKTKKGSSARIWAMHAIGVEPITV